MKTYSIIILFFICAFSVNAQVNKKDTVNADSTRMEKIKKMPMDTIHQKIPVKPVLPEEQKDKKKDEASPIRKKYS